VSIAALASVGGSACFRDASADSTAIAEAGPPAAGVVKPAPKPAAPAVLAEATNPAGPVVVQVLEAKRVTADTIRLTLAVTNKAPAPAPAPDSTAYSAPPAPPVAPFGDANPADFCLLTADGARRLFVLRDAANQPVIDGNLEALKPGDRRVVQVMFPAPPAQTGRVTLLLGKLALRDLPISQ
jgi:hypothetical protein